VERQIPADDGVMLSKISNLVIKHPMIGSKSMGKDQTNCLGIPVLGDPIMNGAPGRGDCFFQHDEDLLSQISPFPAEWVFL
jgi:hypothetical protein